MPDSSEKSILAASVVEILYGDMLSSPIRVKKEWPEDAKEQMLKSQRIFRENHRMFSIQLYEQHMTAEELQALLDFHTSDIGKSIKEAQTKIQKGLSKKYQELESQKAISKPPGKLVVRTKTYGLEDDEDP